MNVAPSPRHLAASTPVAPAAVAFDFERLGGRERYKLLIGSVLPRPIALVTSISSEGVANAAPYSFFNVLSAEPAILALGVEFKTSGAQKDTGRNIRDTQCFVVHICSVAIAEAMNACAVPFGPEIDELAEAGFTTAPGVKVAAPRILQAPVAFECRHHITLGIGGTREIILGEVVMAHYRADLVDAEKYYVDPVGLDAIGRMGGAGYSTTRDRFDLATMTVEQWRAGERARMRKIPCP